MFNANGVNWNFLWKVLLTIGSSIIFNKLLQGAVRYHQPELQRPMALMKNEKTGEQFFYQTMTSQPTCIALTQGLEGYGHFSIRKKDQESPEQLRIPLLLSERIEQCMQEKFDDCYKVNSQSLPVNLVKFNKIKTSFLALFMKVMNQRTLQDLTLDGLEQFGKLLSDIRIGRIDSQIVTQLPPGSGKVLIFDGGGAWRGDSGIVGFDWSRNYKEHELRQAAHNLVNWLYAKLPTSSNIFMPTYQAQGTVATRPGMRV